MGSRFTTVIEGMIKRRASKPKAIGSNILPETSLNFVFLEFIVILVI
jgi:hypothetical protein